MSALSCKQPARLLTQLITTCAAFVFLLGCEEARRVRLSAEGPTPAGSSAGASGETGGGAESTAGSAAGVEAPPDLIEPRAPRRVTVAQLARSIEGVTGGLRWIEDFGQGPVDMLEFLAPTLGAPDYRGVTHENLEPSLLLSKFVQDGAQRVCEAWVTLDRDPALSAHTLVELSSAREGWESREPRHVKQNLERLLLVFFAYSAQGSLPGEPEADDPRVSALYELFELVSAASPSDPAGDAWLAVCLALMTDPEFVMY